MLQGLSGLSQAQGGLTNPLLYYTYYTQVCITPANDCPCSILTILTSPDGGSHAGSAAKVVGESCAATSCAASGEQQPLADGQRPPLPPQTGRCAQSEAGPGRRKKLAKLDQISNDHTPLQVVAYT